MQSSYIAKTKLGNPLLNNSDSESISELSTGIVVYIGLNGKHSQRINLKLSAKERLRLKNSSFIWDFN